VSIYTCEQCGQTRVVGFDTAQIVAGGCCGRRISNGIQYAHLAPVRAALEAIQANMILGVAVAFDRPLWDALVKSVQGKK
jgi:hypothetical protein